MSDRQKTREHLIAHQEITTKDVEKLANGDRVKILTINRYLQSDENAGRIWNWTVYNIYDEPWHPGEAWFRKRLKKPLKRMTVLK